MIFPLSGIIAAQMLDQYEIIRTIGEGGAGVVYEALQLASERVVAIKMLADTDVVDEHSLQRFKREAKTTSALDHPNIVKIFSFGISEDSRPYFVMEFLKGKTLAEVLRSEGTPSVERLQNIFLELMSALEYAHKQGVVHRDIKPGNIMLCVSDNIETAKLLDFGIARKDDVSDEHKLTKTGTLVGSPAYMSPEQCKGQKLDFRSDIYSLGCVMYECVCGKAPFAGENSVNVLMMHINDVVPPIESVRNDLKLPPKLPAIIYSCLEKDPLRRPQSMTELRSRTREAFEDEPVLLKNSAKKTLQLPLKVLLPLVLLLFVGVGYVFVMSGQKAAQNEIETQWIAAKSELKLANTKKLEKRFGEAYSIYEKGVGKLDQIIRSKPDSGMLIAVKSLRRKNLIEMVHCYGATHFNRPVLLNLWRESLAAAREEFGPNSHEAAEIEYDLAFALAEDNENFRAEVGEVNTLLTHCVSVAKRQLDLNPTDPDYSNGKTERARVDLALADALLSKTLQLQGRFKESTDVALQILKLYPAGEYTTQSLIGKIRIVQNFSSLNDKPNELKWREDVLSFAKTSEISYQDKVGALFELFDFYIKSEQYESANCVLNVMTDLSAQGASLSSPGSVARVTCCRARLLEKKGLKSEALAEANKAYAILQTISGGDAPLDVWRMLSSIYDSLGASSQKQNCLTAVSNLRR